MQFFYIGKSYGSRKVEGDTFRAYRYKDKVTKKITLYPIIPTSWSDDKKVFIPGMGYKKVGKNVVEVPVFDGNPKHWNEYLDETVDKEINTDNDVFPTSVADRIRYLFGDEAFTIYNYLVDNYLDPENV